jgi:hypothetical protein
LREEVDMICQVVSESTQEVATFAGWPISPSRKRGVGRFDRLSYLIRLKERHISDDLSRRGVFYRKNSA